MNNLIDGVVITLEKIVPMKIESTKK